jgi:hypothetical protein
VLRLQVFFLFDYSDSGHGFSLLARVCLVGS